jgi:phospholipase D
MLPKKLPAGRKKRIKKSGLLFIIGLLLGAMGGYQYAHQFHIPASFPTTLAASQATVRFSPSGGCLELVQETIQKAKRQILVQAYSLTSLPIIDELIAAHQRGVVVRVLVDRSQLTSRSSQVKRLKAHGLSVAIDQVGGIAHNKVMLIDGVYVLTGSFNWTQAAEYRNAENLLLLHNEALCSLYTKNWERRAAGARPVDG